MGEWRFQFDFDADSAVDAENFAAGILGHLKRQRGSSLRYMDPISGEWKLWAAPAKIAPDLERERARE